jgi:hypothetical protein
MNKYILTGTICAGVTMALAVVSPVLAVTSTVSATPSAADAPKTKQIENLMDRLATKVAELRQTQKKAVFGTVKAATVSTITVETTTKDVKVEMPDDVVVYQMIKGKRTKLAAENVEKADTVTVFGEYDATLDMMTAKAVFIEAASQPIRFVGTVGAVDKVKYSFTVSTKENRSYTVDYETGTKYLVWDPAKGLVKGGFSKLIPGDVVGVTGTPTADDDTKISAGRIVTLSFVAQATPTPAASPSASVKPTAASAK